MPPGRLEEVQIFGGIKGPYGDAVFNSRRPGSYKSTMHMSVEEGQMVPFFDHTEVSSLPPAVTGGAPLKPNFVTEWVNSAGDQIILYGAAGTGHEVPAVMRIDSDGVADVDKAFGDARTFASEIPVALHSDGSTVPYLFACFGSSGSMEFRNVAGTWAAATGTPAQPDGVYSENGNLWAVVNGYQVRKWPAGTNPTSGTAGAAVDVGNSAFDITGAGLLARSYIVFTKPDGIYVYDVDHNRFENIAEGLARNPHPLTGVRTYTFDGDVYVPLGWGGMLRITRDLEVWPASPLPREASPDHKIAGRGRVKSMAADASHLYAAIEPFTQRLGSEVGLSVLTTQDDAAFNDRSTVSTDNDPNTSWTIADISPSGADSKIYVGADVRHGGFWMDIQVAQQAAAVPAGPVEYWNGSAWMSIAYTDWTSWIGETGPILPDSPVPDDWATTTVGGVADKYWLRWEITSGTLRGTTEIREVRVFPDAVALVSGTNVTNSGYDEAGLRTKIIKGTPVRGGMIWDDVVSIAGDFSDLLIFSQLQAIGKGKNLIAIGGRAYKRFPVGNSARPQEEEYPDVTNSFASIFHAHADDRISQGERAPTTQKGVEYILIQGEDFDEANDTVEAWVIFDGGAEQFYGRAHKLPTKLEIPRHDSARGYRYETIVALQDGVRGRRPPKITSIVDGVYTLEGPPTKV